LTLLGVFDTFQIMIRTLCILLISAPAIAQSVKGVVFSDLNGNGLRDKNETGIANVAVSDQVQVVQTGADGTYSITKKGFGYLMISIPNGFQVNGKPWKELEANTSNMDFGLLPAGAINEFTFIHASDTHISEQSVNRIEKLKNIVESRKPNFVLVTGDLVRDALRVPEEEAKRYYQLYVDNIKKLTSPVWSVPGNHEIFGIERHLSLVSPKNPLYGKKMYRQYLGPNYYSFNYGGVHFVALDDVDYEDMWYFGHVDSVQMQWLKEDLAVVPRGTPVVTFKHIPFFSGGLSLTTFEETGPGRTLERENNMLHFRHVVSNAHEVVDLITKNHVYPISLSGHYHARQIYEYESTGQNIRFEQTGAVVGPAQEGKITFPSGVVQYSVKVVPQLGGISPLFLSINRNFLVPG
jgi:predicted MPP superfamily phosphohydrolase